MASEIGTGRAVRQSFYGYALACAVLIVFAGFARTYFLKVFFGTPVLYPLLHLHGIVMTSWFVLFGAQTWLVQAHRTDLHRRLGIFGVLLALLILLFGAAVVTINAREGRVPPGAPAAVIVALSYMNLLVFGVLVAAALWLRTRSEFHKRLMLLATISLLSAAISRIPLDFLGDGLLAVFGPVDLFIIACLAYDTWRHRRLHPAFGWGGLLSIVWPVLGILMSGLSSWGSFTNWLLAAGT
ncbi:MAG TPA: hypothetical protein VGI93_06015 [Steroidobacteraceae bacterium]|jgi:hypothetical protein